MENGKLLLVAGVALGLGILAMNGIRHIRLSRAVDNMIERNPGLFGPAPATQTRPPWAF